MKPVSKRVFALPAVAAIVASMLSVTTPAAAAEPTLTPPCVDDPVALGPEEELVTEPAPRELIRSSGLDDFVRAFAEDLCAQTGAAAVDALIEDRSRDLWTRGIDAARAMGEDGRLDADDRPLYWARLAMIGALKQWSADNQVPEATLATRVAVIDRLSRGQDTLDPDASDRDVVVLTGFDPFFLYSETRTSNPSGAIALALDGMILDGPDGPVEVQTALFPVRWRDFGDGMVEKALTPALSAANTPELFFTVSQGSPESFDLEAFNGSWRGGTIDNERSCYQGTIPIPGDVTTVRPQPQWTRSTLPREAMVDEVDGRPFAVNDRRSVTELPGDTPVSEPRLGCPADSALNEGTTREDGPTEGSVARAGGGGDYLSNEIAYRATLLRDALGLEDLPGGHVHTPVLEGVKKTETEISNPDFVANRQDIIAQTKLLLESALAQQPGGDPEPADEPTYEPAGTPTGAPTSP
ncbi:pyroglutamyl peptidase [Brevibacterium casei]|uniref:pyroglutamyl peptidase n=1 Tax=Brevibacterium casei TaxID=33889 RepID=UPI00344B6377